MGPHLGAAEKLAAGLCPGGQVEVKCQSQADGASCTIKGKEQWMGQLSAVLCVLLWSAVVSMYCVCFCGLQWSVSNACV